MISNISFEINLYENTNQLIDSHSNYLKGISVGVGIIAKKWDIDIGFYNLETAGLISSISLTYKK